VDKHELIKIVVTAVVAVIAKEILSWFVTTSKKVAVRLKSKLLPWVKDPLRFDLALQTFTVLFFFWMFWLKPPPPTPVTHLTVRTDVLIGCIFFTELYWFVVKLRRYTDLKKQIAKPPPPKVVVAGIAEASEKPNTK